MISEETRKLVLDSEKELDKEFKEIDNQCSKNSEKVLMAFINNHVSEADFNSTTGYGYNDLGREKIEKIFSEVLGSEDAIVRNQFISGSHALTVCLFAMLRPGDTMLSICGKPYDTLDQVIGLVENSSSLASYGVKYEQIDLSNDDFDIPSIQKVLKDHKIKLIELQRSKGYSTRKSLTIDKVEKVIKAIREVDQEVIIMIDNCYCELVEDKSPVEVGADIMVGSLIKNLGGGIAPNGAYIAGRKNLIDLCGERLTLPGEGREVGPTLGINKMLLQGLFIAPSVVASALKTAVLTSKCLEKLGYDVEPKYNEHRADIVQNIIFHNADDLIKYVQGVQSASPVDSDTNPIPDVTPGYVDPVVMAAGCFTQGSSIEFSCDGPVRDPYIAYQQGALTYDYGKLGVMKAIDNIRKCK